MNPVADSVGVKDLDGTVDGRPAPGSPGPAPAELSAAVILAAAIVAAFVLLMAIAYGL